jgi:hypothetical protein
MRGALKIVLAALLAVSLVLVGGFLWVQRKTDAEVRALLARADQEPGEVVTGEMLAPLPEPVQRYLRYSGVVGKPLVKTVRLKQRGRIRENPEQPWMAYTAEQYYSVSPPAFIWRASTSLAGLPLVRIRDRYEGGEGHMWVSLDGLYSIVDAKGAAMDHASLMRYLNEMMWFPSSFLGENVTWEPLDNHSARVTLTDNGLSASAILYFDEEGRVTDFLGTRHREGYGVEEWSTPITAYREMNGLRLPVGGQGVWHPAEGQFAYVELDILEIEYDEPALY